MSEPTDLRQLAADTAEGLGLVERVVADYCQFATPDNFELRMALLELRILRDNLAEAGR